MPRILLLALVALACTASLAQAAGHARFFLSPSGNISCELDVGRTGVADAAYCQSLTPALSATLSRTGHLTQCTGQSCLGNPPENDATLAYGKTAALGPFRCTSRATGVTCTTPHGGFRISRAGVASVG